MTADDLDQLPDVCPDCSGPRDAAELVRAGSGQAGPGERDNGQPHHSACAGRSSAGDSWARTVTDYWGLCGVMASVDHRVIGFLTLAPAPMAPRTGRYANAHLSADVGVLLGVSVVAEHRGHGLGRQLIQSAAAELVRRQVSALEALGSIDGTDGIPVDFLLAVGFRVVAEHPSTPRVRMDLSSTARWRPDLAAAWQRLSGLVSRPAPPQPAGFKQSRQAEPAPSGR